MLSLQLEGESALPTARGLWFLLSILIHSKASEALSFWTGTIRQVAHVNTSRGTSLVMQCAGCSFPMSVQKCQDEFVKCVLGRMCNFSSACRFGLACSRDLAESHQNAWNVDSLHPRAFFSPQCSGSLNLMSFSSPSHTLPAGAGASVFLEGDGMKSLYSSLLSACLNGNVSHFSNVFSALCAAQQEGGEVAPDSSVVGRVLSLQLDRDGNVGVPLFWAGYSGRSALIDCIQKMDRDLFKSQCLPVAKQLFDYQRDLAAVSILVRAGTPAAVISLNRGETALHRLARRTRPDAALIHELLKAYRSGRSCDTIESSEGACGTAPDGCDDIDALNNDGYSALMLVAMLSKGTDGRSAAQVLLSHGADVLCVSASPRGGNARTLAQNPHVRSVLGYRACSTPLIDDESRHRIDAIKSVFDLPPLPELSMEKPNAVEVAQSRLNPQSTTDDEKSLQMRSTKTLDKEGVDSLVQRLHDQALQLREAKSAATRQALEPSESRRLTADEQLSVAERLCDESMADRAAKRDELQAKYLLEREPNPLDEELQAESAARLCNQSLEHRQQRLRELDELYWPQTGGSPKKVLTADEMKACASRLHDESITATRSRLDKLATKYLSRSVPDRKLSPEERAESRARLSQPRAR